jgi:hypothetical protein
MKEDIFYRAKLKSYVYKFLEVGFNYSESYEQAEKKLNLEYDSRGRYLGPSSKPFFDI